VAKLLLLDGHSLAYRAFFALPTDLATASGQVTNAVYGFTSMLIFLLNEHHPDAIAVAFDRPEPTFRHESIPDYKAGRTEAPDILRQQLGLVRQVVDTLGISTVELAGFEADDCIATLATMGRDRGDDVIIVTGDRDAYQLVEDPHIRVLYNKRGVSEYALYDEAGILEKTGVRPVDYPQYAALRGDPSDNLPGVPGVGEKTAAKLINDYGDLDGIFANVEKCTPKLRQSLIDHETQVRRNATATPLLRDLPLEYDIDEFRMGEFDEPAVRDLFKFLEFRTLYDRLIDALGDQVTSGSAPVTESLDVEVTTVASAADARALLDAMASSAEPLAIVAGWAGEEGRSPLTGLALAGDASPTASWIPADVLSDEDVRAGLGRLMASGGRPVRTHRAKELMRGLLAIGVDLRTLDVDSAIAAYLVDPGESQYVLEDLAAKYAGVELRTADSPGEGQLDLGGTAVDVGGATGRCAVAVARVADALAAALDARHQRALYDDIERPLVRVLARMELVGVRVDEQQLKTIANGLSEEVSRLEHEIHEVAGGPFVVNSTPQLRAVLFDKLGLQPQKRTKTGFSTDAASLEKLRGQHEIIELLLRYREVEKLRSTYGESLLAEVGDDGRIRATFHQTVARTGRLSSDRPNLHNIPVRTEEGRRFRACFIPAEGCRFLVADYNQIELRVIAHLANDPGLVDAFTSGQDIHTATASRVFAVEPGDVTIAQRSKAKMVSYGLAYGMESFGLAQRLNIAVDEAAEILRAYFVAFPNVKDYMDRVVAEARDRGYTETVFGRRRQIPELSATNYRIRQAGERQAMNAGIQGTAADIFKVALVRLDNALEAAGHYSRIVLQIHDEVILEVPPDEEDAVSDLVLSTMRGAAQLDVPLDVNLSWGASWADAKS
jgi:DNA polymerase I